MAMGQQNSNRSGKRFGNKMDQLQISDSLGHKVAKSAVIITRIVRERDYLNLASNWRRFPKPVQQ